MEDDPYVAAPSATSVAARAIVMSAVVCRGNLEAEFGDPDAEVSRQEVVGWLRNLELNDELEELEQRMLQTPIGQLSHDDRMKSTWRVEGLAMLGVGASDGTAQKRQAQQLVDAVGAFRRHMNADQHAEAQLAAAVIYQLVSEMFGSSIAGGYTWDKLMEAYEDAGRETAASQDEAEQCDQSTN